MSTMSQEKAIEAPNETQMLKPPDLHAHIKETER